MRIACIGSREIELPIEELMEEIGAFIVSQGDYIASGNADGSDAAYARGGNKVDPSHVILYLPWDTYNSQYLRKGNRITTESRVEWEEVARRHHPVFEQLKQGARKMMIRNAGILSRADKCVAYLNHGKKGGGGTGHGWRIAGEMGIPRLDLASEDWENTGAHDRLMDFLTKPIDKS